MPALPKAFQSQDPSQYFCISTYQFTPPKSIQTSKAHISTFPTPQSPYPSSHWPPPPSHGPSPPQTTSYLVLSDSSWAFWLPPPSSVPRPPPQPTFSCLLSPLLLRWPSNGPPRFSFFLRATWFREDLRAVAAHPFRRVGPAVVLLNVWDPFGWLPQRPWCRWWRSQWPRCHLLKS